VLGVLRALAQTDVQYVLIGELPAALHGSPLLPVNGTVTIVPRAGQREPLSAAIAAGGGKPRRRRHRCRRSTRPPASRPGPTRPSSSSSRRRPAPPDRFERLARRLLREAGFIPATVTGRSGDGGIDGIGVYRLSLVSFPVFFQCKRYKGSVGAGAVRDFRGAMSGRGDKGLLITTSSFTADAKQEATRDGAPPVDLIDGDRLCELLRQYELGVRRTIRQIEEVEVVPEFFEDI
jgi:hypothetical protein